MKNGQLAYYRSYTNQADNESAFTLLLAGTEKENARRMYRLAAYVWCAQS